jgi:hypothetical protein
MAAVTLLAIPLRPASAQSVPLKLEILGNTTPRSSGPLPLDIELTWGGASILEGRLVLTFRDGPMFFGRAVSHDLALNVGRNRFRMLLPTLDGRSAFQTIDIIGAFITEKSEIELEARPIRVPPPDGRVFRILYCDPIVRGTDRTVSKLYSSLRFERFWRNSRDETPDNRFDASNLTTNRDIFVPDDMPQDPHWFCSYNMVILSQAGFSELRSRQLGSLAQWVRAGGSLVVEPLGGLEQQQLDFLNGLDGSEEDRFTTGPDGHLDVPADEYFEQLASGLGRVAVMYRPFTEQDFTTPAWNEAVARLWHFRSDQIATARDEGRFEWLDLETLLPTQGSNRNNQNNYYGGNYDVPGWQFGGSSDDLRVRELKSGQGLLDKLMPSEVEVVPLSYIGLILLFYVLTIGPLDYFVLGALRLRRFTWITFPAATVLFTLFTVWLSHSFLDASTERSQIRVFDMGSDGSVLRSNRIELLFTMSSHDVTTDIRSGLFTAMNHSRFGGQMHDYRYRRNMNRESVPPPTVQGRPPGVYQVLQEMPQWTPQMNRVLAIAPDAETLPGQTGTFDWNRQWSFSSGRNQNGELANAIREAFGHEAQAWLYNQRDIHSVTGENGSLFPISTVNFNHHQMRRQVQDAQVLQELQQLGRRQVDFLTDISVRLQGRSLFGVVSRIAPHGGDNFEDLTILDPSNADEWLLVIVLPNAEDIRIYRRLYHVSGSDQ